MGREELHFNGHVYVDAGPAPCPEPGCEHGMVATTVNGTPAWWQKGRLYIRDYSRDLPENPWHIDWPDQQ
jgi:hypothetical protein